MDLKDKKVLVIGTGLSGIGSAHLLCGAGAWPVLLDENEKVNEADVRAKLEQDADNVKIVIGKLPQELADEISLVVPSPAVPLDTDTIMYFKNKSLIFWISFANKTICFICTI